jgi:4-hydroxybenzoate polyprenyltransferase
MLEVNGFELQLSSFNFALLVVATVLITAAGYVINDYFDTHTDFLNRPKTVLVGTVISRRSAIIFHSVLNVIAVLIGFYLAYKINMVFLGFVFLIVTGLLWFYSTTYKRQFLVGNILVAFLTALVPLMVVLFEIPLLNEAYREVLIKNNANFMYIFYWVLAFSFFAFITNLMREIIKDIEDFEGDSAYGRNSLPVVLGVKTSKIITISLAVITLGSLNYIYFQYLEDSTTIIYFSLFLYLPFLFLIARLIYAKTKKQFRNIGNILKIIMLLGILYSLVVRYIVQNQVI